MIVAVAVEDLPLLAAVMLVRNLAHHLEGLLVRLGPRVGIVNHGQARHLLDQALGEFGAGDGALAPAKKHSFVSWTATARAMVSRPKPTFTVQTPPETASTCFLAGDIPDAQAPTLDDDLGIHRFKRFVLNQVMPDMGRSASITLRGSLVLRMFMENLKGRAPQGGKREFLADTVPAGAHSRATSRAKIGPAQPDAGKA